VRLTVYHGLTAISIERTMETSLAFAFWNDDFATEGLWWFFQHWIISFDVFCNDVHGIMKGEDLRDGLEVGSSGECCVFVRIGPETQTPTDLVYCNWKIL
jgi:hypothetical protein